MAAPNGAVDVTAAPWLHNYIPAGCLKIPTHDYNLPPEICLPSELQGWRFFSRGDAGNIPAELLLAPVSQTALLATTTLHPFVGLFLHKWIQLEFKSGLVRVYLFPHDVDRSVVNRHDGKLTKAISSLLSQLDYSPQAWKGVHTSAKQDFPRSAIDDQADVSIRDADMSLLERFNSLPSPDPRLESVSRETAFDMQDLMSSKIPGLHTTLYPHQRRSAALMLQKELEPGFIIDPRLRRAVDQAGRKWYYDIVVGLVLKDPRYYDGVCGGILAEQMGSGKTLICLALILATKHWVAQIPPLLDEVPIRPKVGSLMDMAAAATNKHVACAWKLHENLPPTAVKALERPENRASYKVRDPLVEPRKSQRAAPPAPPARQIFVSSASLVIVPPNLVTQWQEEIKKHTTGLRVLTIASLSDPIPPKSVLLKHDIILFSHSRFEKIEKERASFEGKPRVTDCPLEHVRFKRCIVDEGHRLGGGGSWMTYLLKGLDNLELAARWAVTGTPSRGLYGTEEKLDGGVTPTKGKGGNDDVDHERQDLSRIGNITSKFLKVRPWCNTRNEAGDSPADWNVYVMQRRHNSRGSGRSDCLQSTLESLIIRHRLSDVSTQLPSVDERIVKLEGSYQDKLSLNLFSMMIIFNSVQSQRTDQDYFFHPKQRKSLLELVHNLKQASFFGGVFFSVEQINKSIETAETFLEKKDVPISEEDCRLLSSAIALGKTAVVNRLKCVSNQFHAMPLYIDHFPGGRGHAWSLDDRDTPDEPVCTDAGMVLALQKFLNPCIDAPTSLQLMIESGRLDQQGWSERDHALALAEDASGESRGRGGQPAALAGNTPIGNDRHTRPKSGALRKDLVNVDEESTIATQDIEVAGPLAMTQLISTVSVKLSYLVDSIIKYQEDEQILIFYENENVAYYLAVVLESLQVQHLIYAKTLSVDRRARYVATFTHNPKFRVMLMDISQAAFGLDMRSASRVYFTSPILDPQVEAQAIGRARRIGQMKTVTVETLVLKDSLEEFIIERREAMTQAEHRKVKTILDDGHIKEWIRNARIIPLPEAEEGVAQTAMLPNPQYVFGRGFGRELHPDEDLLMGSPEAKGKAKAAAPEARAPRTPLPFSRGPKRARSPPLVIRESAEASSSAGSEPPAKRKVGISWADVKAWL